MDRVPRSSHIWPLMDSLSPGFSLAMTFEPIMGASRRFKNPSGVFSTTAHPSAYAHMGDDGVVKASSIAAAMVVLVISL
jgi:hypothetical protein